MDEPESRRKDEVLMKQLIAYLNAENELKSSIELQAAAYEASGADGLYLYNFTEEETGRDEFFHVVRSVVKQVDIPIIIGCNAVRFEDVKKAYYTGAERVALRYKSLPDKEVMKEVTGRFAGASLLIEFNEDAENSDGLFGAAENETLELLQELQAGGIIIKHLDLSEKKQSKITSFPIPVYIRDSLKRNDIRSLMGLNNVEGVATNLLSGKSFMNLRQALRTENIEISTLKSSVSFEEMKKDAAGLVTVVVQDYRNNEVLMVAYMNEEAFEKTIESGKMTYYSRSRQELWVKGETSGHTQYVKSLSIDCDGDALLAKVKQIGAACHTGNRSCFYTTIVERMMKDREPFSVLTDVYDVIIDRKRNPKEGSYTNYLFNKGIDKILKKCGEEAAEIIIAAKNPDKEEIKYEIADFLYHVMVLMAECGIDWEDVTEELAHRR